MTSYLKYTLILLFILSSKSSWSQDSLVLKTGACIAFQKIYQTGDLIEIITMNKEEQRFDAKDVFGYYDLTNDASFYLLDNPEKGAEQPYLFLDRIQIGTINMYIINGRDYSIYLEKNDLLLLVYSEATAKEQFEKHTNALKNAVSDDKVTIDYIDSKKFKLTPSEIETIVVNYNKRNFYNRPIQQGDFSKNIFLYRTKFQKSKEKIRIILHGESYDLDMEDFISLTVPVKYQSKLTLSDQYTSTEILIASNLTDQYFEVYYDKRTDSFLLDPKTGSELHYEFNKIKEKVNKKGKNK